MHVYVCMYIMYFAAKSTGSCKVRATRTCTAKVGLLGGGGVLWGKRLILKLLSKVYLKLLLLFGSFHTLSLFLLLIVSC